MTIFTSIPDNPDMVQVFKKFNDGLLPLCEYHDVILRGDSPFTVGERELIASYVSGLNACRFCFGAHVAIAQSHGIDPGLLDRLLENPDSSGVDPRLLPVLAYVRKLTLSPSKISGEDARAVYEAGWTEQALFHAVSVCALFNFMNRIVEGCGITPSDTMNEDRQQRLVEGRDNPAFYTHFARMVLDAANDPD
jgi:uncharacterized peroxidase-related enzyme